MQRLIFDLKFSARLWVIIFGVAFFVSGCGGSGPHLPLVLQGEQSEAGGAVGEGEAEGAGEASYTFGFFEDIQPIIAQRCSLCHPGATPDNWSNYEESSGKAELLALRVGSGTMPPGNATQMTDEERDMILIWVEEGAPRGEESEGLGVEQ